ncbi:DUF3408 domain-containing protein [Sphingobacterium lactis]|uniref:DUF3408 domain-containing protein n=1 Tax=Sphingobacterium lactis TaxID=797291 RepID=UPI003DA6B58D
MNRDNEKRVTPNLDENELMNLMVDGIRKDGFKNPIETTPAEQPENKKPVIREQNRTERISPTEYEEIFFKEVKSTARHGKSAYIDPVHHKKLTRIVQVIGDDNITIYAYLYNLLEHHFTEFEELIKEIYEEKHKPLF